jgi:MOSC domain-containing protein YiiM
MIIQSLNVGKIQQINGMETAFGKAPLDGPVFLGALGFAGDHQANKKYHGGPEKAVCVYSADRLPYWTERYGRPLAHPAFGENLTITGLTEETAFIGDIFRIGTAVVQISQPRVPCETIARIHSIADLSQAVRETGYSGWYLRVLTEGEVRAGDALEWLERPAGAITVARVNQIFHQQRNDREAVASLLEVPALAVPLREWATERLAQMQ